VSAVDDRVQLGARRRLDEEDDHRHAEDRDDEAGDEEHVEGAAHPRQNQERDDRTDERARRVERAMEAERRRQILRATAKRDERVPRSGAQALADAVDRHDAGDRRPGGAGGDDQQPAGRRDAVADRGQLLVLARAIPEHAAEDSHERGHPLVQAVDQTERHRTDPELEDEIHRKDARDHLRRDVRQEAREPERPDGGADPLQPRSRRTLPRESENRSPVERVHERTE
jgi:hypothetical protein